MYSIIPFDSISVSDNLKNHEPFKLFDGKIDTSWAADTPNSYIQVNFFFEHLISAVDFIFADSGSIYTFEVLVLKNNNWISLGNQTLVTTQEGVMRVYIPYFVSKSIRIKFLSVEKDNHISLRVEIPELRVMGMVQENEPQTNSYVPPLPCPIGYIKDKDGQQCVPETKYDIVVANQKTTVKFEKRNDRIKIEFNPLKQVNGFYIKVPHDHVDLEFIINIPDIYQSFFHVQKEIDENYILLNNPLYNVDTLELILLSDTVIQLEQFDILGEK